jgi:copper oxidase (laccase) domain-containing protein
MQRTNATRQEVHASRTTFLSQLGGRELIRVRPSHSANVDDVSIEDDKVCRVTWRTDPVIETDFDYYYDGSDGVLTADRHIAPYIFSGDCVPLAIWDAESDFLGLVHVGLLGALNNAVRGIASLIAAKHISASTLGAYLGPSIGKEDYNVEQSGLWLAIADQVRSNEQTRERVSPFLSPGGYFDLKGMIAAQLQEIGVLKNNIGQFETSTASPKSSFFSHFQATQGGSQPGAFCSLLYQTWK